MESIVNTVKNECSKIKKQFTAKHCTVTINSIQQEKAKLMTDEAKMDHIKELANINVPSSLLKELVHV